MSKKFIFSVSAINKEDLSEIVSAFGTFDVNLTLMFRDKQKLMQTQSYGLECPMLLYPNLEQDQNDHIPNNECQSIYVRLVSDATLHALLDRTGIKFNNEERFSYISQGILKTVNYLIKMNPNIIFFAAPPHHYDTWLFGRIAQFLNIKVGFLSFSIFKNIYIYCDGMPGSCQPKIIKRPTISNNERKIGITGALKTFERATYRGDLSMPATEASLYGENKSKVFRPLQSFFERPLSLKRIIYTANLYKYFNSQKIETQLENLKYWIFFLHYQPERSTLPEGGLYFNQFEAIARLRSLLPIDVTILVKEHPSTFRRLSDPRYRNKSFYRKINSLTKTFLIGFSQSSYDLIDTSQGSSDDNWQNCI